MNGEPALHASGNPGRPIPGLCRSCLSWSDRAAEPCARCGSTRLVRHPELADLSVAHIDCDAFYAAVEKRDNPAIRDKPVIVGHPGGRGVVTTACYMARRFGPRSAMPMFQALRLCPDAVVIPPNMETYRRVSRQIRAILSTLTPIIEPVSLDEAYLDLGDDVRADPALPAVQLARLAAAVERDVGITISIGLAGNKFLAKLASDLDKPRGFAVIGRAEAKSILAPMPVGRILGVGQATAAKLASMGIVTIADLQAIPPGRLAARFGRFGRRLAQYAQGEDDRAVTPTRLAKSISAETTFGTDLRTCDDLAAALAPLCDRVGLRLERAGLGARTVVLKLKTADFQILTRHRRLADPTRRAKVIRDAGTILLRREATGRAFRLVGIGVTELCPAGEADVPDLFASGASASGRR